MGFLAMNEIGPPVPSDTAGGPGGGTPVESLPWLVAGVMDVRQSPDKPGLARRGATQGEASEQQNVHYT